MAVESGNEQPMRDEELKFCWGAAINIYYTREGAPSRIGVSLQEDTVPWCRNTSPNGFRILNAVSLVQQRPFKQRHNVDSQRRAEVVTYTS